MDHLLLTVEAAADVIGVGRTRMFSMITTGEIESVRIGKSRRVPRQALEDFVEKLRSGAREAS